jgi:major vault protein
MANEKSTNELVLSNGEYAYTQDTTSGVIKIMTGPTVVNITGQEYPVVYDASTRRFVRVELQNAAQQCPLAPQGHYLELSNPPAKDSKQPNSGKEGNTPELLIGQKVNIPGPRTFSLWPRQHAKVIEGHQLRSNEYLLVRVYDEEAARLYWGQGVVKAAVDRGETKSEEEVVLSRLPDDLSVGKLLVIKGTEVSFYIPPTGIEVVPDEGGDYVREALTLERLQYCILIDEDGSKEYPRGPQVVFPRPTQTFFTKRDKEGNPVRVFAPVELNEIQGIHIKVIAAYKEGGREYKEGNELFLTGKDTPIYFPRQEHSLISYDSHSKHFATAIPSGEARYVMERTTGKIEKVLGPCMLLPNPITQVVVRRVLNPRQCMLWYPGNGEVLEYNNQLGELLKASPTTRSGTVSEGEVERARSAKRMVGNAALTASSVNRETRAVLADEFTRGSSYTQPRTITLDTKFSGVPAIDIWTGYAVMVVSKTGNRRVELGPKTLLLDYDEHLEVLSLSTGKPKNTDDLLLTVYLRVKNNQISDHVYVETKDHVRVKLSLSLRVDFEGDPEKWFDAENYVKLLCDHVRSILKGWARRISIEEFYIDPTAIVQDAVLGAKDESGKRNGLVFKENGMILHDVEVLGTDVSDESIAQLLNGAQLQSVRSAIELAKAERDLQVLKRKEAITRETVDEQNRTADHRTKIQKEDLARKTSLELEQINARLDVTERQTMKEKKEQDIFDLIKQAELARLEKEKRLELTLTESRSKIEMERLQEETTAVVRRFEASQQGLSEALIAANNQEVMARLAEAASIQTFLGGRSFSDVLVRIFKGSPMEKTFQRMVEPKPAEKK